ncbi:hypothetical protein D910_06233 [Dendroctonus ponderosae]|uniref:Uncharacterized protein n=1 Tax=Dendroctonus ponderosae TaxID=77166 RepID=U4UE55_DENPD|nr:hypothetical protein D910_06233 [Dendroctonus ponderosae]
MCCLLNSSLPQIFSFLGFSVVFFRVP